jgi:hypothetical protein
MAKSVKKASAQPKTAVEPKAVEGTAAVKPRKTISKKTNGSVTVTVMSLSHERVAMLAHQFWLERGQLHGYHEDDWFRAEQALLGMAS